MGVCLLLSAIERKMVSDLQSRVDDLNYKLYVLSECVVGLANLVRELQGRSGECKVLFSLFGCRLDDLEALGS